RRRLKRLPRKLPPLVVFHLPRELQEAHGTGHQSLLGVPRFPDESIRKIGRPFPRPILQMSHAGESVILPRGYMPRAHVLRVGIDWIHCSSSNSANASAAGLVGNLMRVRALGVIP